MITSINELMNKLHSFVYVVFRHNALVDDRPRAGEMDVTGA